MISREGLIRLLVRSVNADHTDNLDDEDDVIVDPEGYFRSFSTPELYEMAQDIADPEDLEGGWCEDEDDEV